MKRKLILLVVCSCSFLNAAPQMLRAVNEVNAPAAAANTNITATKKTLNFFIIAPPKKGKLDLGSRYNIVRGKCRNIFRQKHFMAFVAKDVNMVNAKVQKRLRKYNANIGTLWFDSHGSYKKGYAVFYVGKQEINYKNISDSLSIQPLQALAAYTNENSKVVIGACYGGATFYRKSLYSPDTVRMNGDSLMMGLGKIFSQSTIYACESWVMTKPGLFRKKAAVAGHPTRKLFKDIVYQPAWENMNRWNAYCAARENFSSINPVTMDADGNLQICTATYAGSGEVQYEIAKGLKKLRPGLLKVH